MPIVTEEQLERLTAIASRVDAMAVLLDAQRQELSALVADIVADRIRQQTEAEELAHEPPGCAHSHRRELPTMGKGPASYLCLDCQTVITDG